MKTTILFLLLVGCAITGFTQSTRADSLKLVLQNEKEDSNRISLLADIGTAYVFEKPELGLSYTKQAVELARTTKDLRREAGALNALGHLYRMTSNYEGGVKSHLNALHISEKLKDTVGIALAYFGIATNYEDQEDYKQALEYNYKVKSLIGNKWQADVDVNMGECYKNLNQLDSALKYEQSAYEAAMHSETRVKPLILNRLGEVHSKLGNNELAFSYFRMSIAEATKVFDNNALNAALGGIAELFQKQGRYDSAIYYANKAMESAKEINDPIAIIDVSKTLFSIYKKTGVTDSAFKYLELSALTKDTLITQDKIKQQQILAFEENSRQQELANAAKLEEENRKQNIQFIAIAIGIITFLILFFALSRSIIIETNFIRFFGVLGLLAVFEFINLLIHPYLETITHHSVVLMLLILISIGALLVPLHHKLEHWITDKMIEKNKKIRLAAAKKTIRDLE